VKKKENKQLVILGAGTAGTMMANHLKSALPSGWEITVVDKSDRHYYQPGFLFVPFDIYKPEQVVKSLKAYLPKGVNFIQKEVDIIDHENNTVVFNDHESINYDLLVIATGTDIAPSEIEGLEGPHWHESAFDFYTFEGASALRKKLQNWKSGHLVVHIAEMPIKCPVAPLEFAFLADSFFKNKGVREDVKITYVTPLDGAFTKPKAAKALAYLLEEKNIEVVSSFNIERVDGENKVIYDYGGAEVSYDLLVTVPTNMGNPMMERSGIGDDLNFVPTDKHTLQSKIKDNIFVIGDATNLPTSKAGSVAHFEADILTENILDYINGRPLSQSFDGHANCFVETGDSKALLIDFNYEHEPTTGTFPIPGVGPLRLLKESRVNHWGKLAFRWVYWNMLVKARPIPFVSAAMNTKGKDIELKSESNTKVS
jgi:sulfide:quinone oxidoreductase